MNDIDWQLIIGYEWSDAEEYLNEEGVAFTVSTTKPPRKDVVSDGSGEMRVIAVRRTQTEQLDVVCALSDWTVS